MEVQTINAGGVFFDYSQSARFTVENQSTTFQQHFKLAKQTMKPTEYQIKLENGYIETYRFFYHMKLRQSEENQQEGSLCEI